jgi:PAS domain S-box-containing protein
MNPNLAITTGCILVLVVLMIHFLSKSGGPNSANPGSWAPSNSLIIVLALFSGSGVLMAMGTIEMAGRYGYSIILALIGFTLIFIFSPLIFFPIRRLSQIIRFATLVDFLTFRYRGKAVAITASISLILIAIPLILAQFLAIKSVANFIFGSSLYSLPILVFAIILLSRHSIKSGGRIVFLVMAAAGLMIVPALGLTAWASIQAAFGTVGAMNSWVVESGQRLIVHRMESSYSLFSVFLTASFALPINFNLLISQKITDRQASMTAWAYPLLVLLACIPVFPILWSGIALQSSSPLQEYLFALPAAINQPVIAGLGAASIILLSVALSCNLTLAISRVVLNSLLLPNKNLGQQVKLSNWIHQRHMIIFVGLLSLCALLSLVIKGRSITDLYLVGFSGLAQLTPGILAVMYLPKVNRQGFIAGLSGGMVVWMLTIAVPALFGDWTWQSPWLERPLSIGMQNWSLWALQALLINLALCVIFSRYGRTDDEQRSFAALCMADNVYIPARVEIKQKSVAQLMDSLRSTLGDAAKDEVNAALESLNYNRSEIRPAALRQLRDNINASLNLRYGILAATRVMEQSLPLAPSLNKEPDDIYLIESVLAIHGNRLTGIASELNKLRVHHREILDKLPIGIISIDQGGEILKWNSTIANYTGIDVETATGSYISDLAEPWRTAIANFLDSGENSTEHKRLELAGNVRWYSLQKSVEQTLEGSNSDIILLIEDQTDSVALTQKSIDNERLASVGRLAAGVAHEIGNPVTGITCLAQNLQHETEPEQIAESVKHILLQTDRINRIVQSLIDFSRGEQSPQTLVQKVSLHKAANEAIELLKLSIAKPEVQFICDIDEQMMVLGDYHQLIQILLNLLSNGRDASPANGLVMIKAVTELTQIRVTISDFGTGVEENISDRLFEPFVTSKEPGQGTGLGLWVVFNLVEKMGAEIAISSPAENSACGTTVTLFFPLSSPP